MNKKLLKKLQSPSITEFQIAFSKIFRRGEDIKVYVKEILRRQRPLIREALHDLTVYLMKYHKNDESHVIYRSQEVDFPLKWKKGATIVSVVFHRNTNCYEYKIHSVDSTKIITVSFKVITDVDYLTDVTMTFLEKKLTNTFLIHH